MEVNAKMSVYNKFTDTNKNIIFKRHIIDNVFWDDSKNVNVVVGIENSNRVDIYIPKIQNDMSNYVLPKQFKGQSDWTLQNGDFIVKGETTETSVSKISELMSKYDNVFIILSVDDKDYGNLRMQHIHIQGK